MQYIISDATSAGEATIQIVFEPGTDPNAAVVNVKTRVDQVMNNLPPLVQREGVIITPIQPSMLMYVNLFSTDKNADEKFLYNYASVHILPELQRISGMGRAQILGSRQYAMRIWLKPDRMRAYNIATDEVLKAIDEQSVIGRPGRLGQASGKTAQSLEYVLTYSGRFNKPEEYEEIIVKANPEGEILKLKDIAEVEGSEFFDIYSNKDAYLEIRNQMGKIDNYLKSYNTKSREVEILNQSINISNSIFNSARADYAEVLFTQREALEAKIDLLEIKKKQLEAKVNIYRSLGGGWQ